MSSNFPINFALTVGMLANTNKDNEISKEELTQYKGTIKSQTDFYGAHVKYRNDLIAYYEANRNVFGNGIDNLIQQLKGQINTLNGYVDQYKQQDLVVNFFNQNYDFMAKQDATGSWGTALKGNAGSMSFNDIYITAQKTNPADQLGSNDIKDDPPPVNNNLKTVDTLKTNFTTLDANKNGVLEGAEIQKATTDPVLAPVANKIAELNRELMFANIDPGNAAWHGLSTNDLDKIKEGLTGGKTFDQIANELREKIAKERGVPADAAGFRAWVDGQRKIIPDGTTPPANASKASIQALQSQFATLDKNKDNILTEAEMKAASTDAVTAPGVAKLAQLNRELMFANIDPGNSAWHGLSAQDLAKLSAEMDAGKTLDQVSNELREKIAKERGVPSDPAAFKEWVDKQRIAMPIPGGGGTTNKNEAIVFDAYRDILGREPDDAGKKGWLDAMNGGLSERDLAKAFFGAPEFTSKNLSPEEVIKRVYRFVLDREPDNGGLTFWVNTLKTSNINAVLDGFFNSPEYKNKPGEPSGGSTL